MADDFDEIFMLHAGGFEPHAVEALAKIVGVIGVELAGEVEADLVKIAGQEIPAVHGFARAAGIDDFTHGVQDGGGVRRV